MGEILPATDKRAGGSTASTQISFEEEVMSALKRVLGKNDVGAKILYLHFARGYSLDEIAKTIGKPQEKVSRCHIAALRTINDALLNKDKSADNRSLFDLLADFF